jgi:hypothetical protein
MKRELIKKEALFNEVKGSLFEYLVAKELSIRGNFELSFQHSLDKNYLNILSQQDRMVRQFYPQMLSFLLESSKEVATDLISYLKEVPISSKVVGKFSQQLQSGELHEADLILGLKEESLLVSLKLNKKFSFVNTKSGGIKSFFTHYFSFIPSKIQDDFNQFVDLEFHRMAFELHAFHDLDYPGHFHHWVSQGLSELPGDLCADSRRILKAYYARIAEKMHHILSGALSENKLLFQNSLPPLLGLGRNDLLQVIFFHEFQVGTKGEVEIHSIKELSRELPKVKILDFGHISSVEVEIGRWSLQIRVKPMNKFTTTAIKINCSIRVRDNSGIS